MALLYRFMVTCTPGIPAFWTPDEQHALIKNGSSFVFRVMDAKKKSSSSGTRTLIIPLEEKTLRSDVKNNSFKSPKAIINKYKRLNFFSYVKTNLKNFL